MKQKNVYNPRPSVVEPVSLCYRCAVSGLVCGLVLASVLAFTVLVCGCSAPVPVVERAEPQQQRIDYGYQPYDPLKASQEYWARPTKVRVVDEWGQ